MRIYLWGLLFSPVCLQAQSPGDSTINKQIKAVASLYYSSMGENSPLYNGRLYKNYSFPISEGTPYFLSGNFSEGDICYEGLTFYKVALLYDLVRDEVVVRNPYNFNPISLRPEKISWFRLQNHRFVWLEHTEENHLKTGLYDELYNGTTGLYVKYEKKITEVVVNQGLEENVSSDDYYYIRKGTVFYPVKNKNAMLDILSGKRREIQQYLGRTGIKYRLETARVLQMAVEYYDQLKK